MTTKTGLKRGAKKLGTRMLAQDNWDRTDWAEQLGLDSQRRQSRWYRQDKKRRTE
jgi:hypothetical protein